MRKDIFSYILAIEVGSEAWITTNNTEADLIAIIQRRPQPLWSEAQKNIRKLGWLTDILYTLALRETN
jgi:hypothetical protein